MTLAWASFIRYTPGVVGKVFTFSAGRGGSKGAGAGSVVLGVVDMSGPGNIGDAAPCSVAGPTRIVYGATRPRLSPGDGVTSHVSARAGLIGDGPESRSACDDQSCCRTPAD